MAIKRRIEIRTQTHQVIRINRRNTVIKGWCARCGQEVEDVKFEKPDLRLSRKQR